VVCDERSIIRIGTAAYGIFAPSSHRVRADDLVIDLDLARRFGPALALSGLNLVPWLVVRNWGSTSFAGARLQIELPGAGDILASLRRLQVGEHATIRLPRLDGFSTAKEWGTGVRPLHLVLGNKRIDHGDLACLLLSPDEWSLFPEHALSLAAFVRPDHPRITSLTRQATTGVPLRAEPEVLMRAVYEHLHGDWHIDYRKDPPPLRPHTQKVRSPDEVLWDIGNRRGQGTCLDLAVLFAGCFENLRLQPLIAIVKSRRSQHALVGCRHDVRRRLDPLPTDPGELLTEVSWLDPNGCTRDAAQRAPFESAAGEAHMILKDRPLVMALDLAAARQHGVVPL
jgi:hypothetical protein